MTTKPAEEVVDERRDRYELSVVGCPLRSFCGAWRLGYGYHLSKAIEKCPRLGRVHGEGRPIPVPVDCLSAEEAVAREMMS